MSIVHRLSDSLGSSPQSRPINCRRARVASGIRSTRHALDGMTPTRAPLLSISLEVAMDQLLSSQPMEGSSSSWIPTPRVSSTRAWTWAERFQSLATPRARLTKVMLASQPVSIANNSQIVPATDATSPVLRALRIRAGKRARSPEARISYRRLKCDPPILASGTLATAHQVSTTPDRCKPVEALVHSTIWRAEGALNASLGTRGGCHEE